MSEEKLITSIPSEENILPGNIFLHIGELADGDEEKGYTKIYVEIIDPIGAWVVDPTVNNNPSDYYVGGPLVRDLTRSEHILMLWEYEAFARSFVFYWRT